MSTDLAPFRSYLLSKSYSDSTIRNYLADVNKYTSYCSSHSLSSPFRPTSISAYLHTISSSPNYKRHLASLSQYFRYATDQKLTNHNPLKEAINPPSPKTSIDSLLSQFATYLANHHLSATTTKNYQNDIRQYIDFLQNNPET